MDQSSVLPATGPTSMEMTFTVNLNGITKTITYPFTATQNILSLSLSKTSIAADQTEMLLLPAYPLLPIHSNSQQQGPIRHTSRHLQERES